MNDFKGFQIFNPYKSFNHEQYSFLDENGNAVFQEILANESVSLDVKRDFWSLWLLGENAYKAFDKFDSQEDFDLAYQEFLMTISMMREATNNCGYARNGNPEDDLSSAELVDLLWNSGSATEVDKGAWGGANDVFMLRDNRESVSETG